MKDLLQSTHYYKRECHISGQTVQRREKKEKRKYEEKTINKMFIIISN